jgi:hypothetical protein
MGFLAKRYKKQVTSWEIWNEPDVDTWMGTPEEYADLVNFAAVAIRKGNPNAAVVLGGLTVSPGDFLDRILAKNVDHYVDILAFHAYPETWHVERTEDIFPRWPKTFVEKLKARGSKLEVWLNEFGYADYKHSTRRASKWSATDDVFFDYEHTRLYQAQEFLRIQLSSLAANVNATTWYRIDDFKSLEGIGDDGDEVNLHLGVVTADGRPKPVFRAMRFYNQYFRRQVQVLAEGPWTPKLTSADLITHAFRFSDGKILIAAWLRLPSVPPPAPSIEILDPDKRVATLDLSTMRQSFPHARAKRLNLFGGSQRSNLNDIQVHGGELVLIEISL